MFNLRTARLTLAVTAGLNPAARQFRKSSNCNMKLSALAVIIALTTAATAAEPNPAESEAAHLANIRQVTLELPRAGEGYFSPDGSLIVYQAYPVGYPFYQ